MQKSPDPGVVAAFVAVLVFLADQWTKAAFFSLDASAPLVILHGILDLIHHENFGIVANLAIPMPVIITVTIAVILLVVRGILHARLVKDHVATIGLGIILGGAIGNLYDRITAGFVYDWILLFGQSAINLADISIVFGALLYFGRRRNQQPIKTAELSE